MHALAASRGRSDLPHAEHASSSRTEIARRRTAALLRPGNRPRDRRRRDRHRTLASSSSDSARCTPGSEVHASAQMTVHDASRRRPVMRRAWVDRVVLAQENTLEDIRQIRAAVPDARTRVLRARRTLHLVLRTVLHVRRDRAERSAEPRLVRAIVHRRTTCSPGRHAPCAGSTAASSSRRKILAAHDQLRRRWRTQVSLAQVEGRKTQARNTSRRSHEIYRAFL